jgi:L-rhamnonate dehydratase
VLPAVEYHLTQEPIRQQVLTDPVVPHDGWLPIRDDVGLVEGYRMVPDAAAVPLSGDSHGME